MFQFALSWVIFAVQLCGYFALNGSVAVREKQARLQIHKPPVCQFGHSALALCWR